jgi:hypothetical protein
VTPTRSHRLSSSCASLARSRTAGGPSAAAAGGLGTEPPGPGPRLGPGPRRVTPASRASH